MKLNKKLIVLLISLLCFLTSCSKKYNEKNYQKYFDSFYDQIITEGSKYVGIDLRTKEEYETSHVRQFQNYDITKGSSSDLLNWLKNNYKNKDYIIYIYDNDGSNKESFNQIKKEYKNVYYCSVQYESINDYLNNKFIIDIGPYDCGC